MYRKAIILLLLAVCATTVIARNRSKPRQKEGNYNFTVAGYVHGNGSATVSGERIKLDANVTTDDGATGELNASSLTLKSNHFSGNGNLMGEQATFEGRVDVPDNDYEKAIRGVRLSCTVRTAGGRYAKLIGYIPSQAQAKDSIDEQEEQERGKGKKK
jgi:hypothetical protein